MIAYLCDKCFAEAYKYATEDHVLRYVEPVDGDGTPTEVYLTIEPPIILSDEQYALAIPAIE
jgi:hypothetical protein